jgi:DNA polymerase alpha subunit A
MDIDGVFKSMLLLKKKKYACLKYIPPYTPQSKIERELKGVDLVRRDWSPLSKNTGSKILDIILSGKSKDEIIVEIYDELKNVSQAIDNDQIDLKDYAITKQLAKNIDEYNDLKALPHVQVAKRLREQGKRNFQIHSFIPYVICLPKETQDENNNTVTHKVKTIVDRAYHPKEIENDPELKIDKIWYKENQILPVIKRLVQHITEITMNQLCESLEIENRSHNMYQNDGDVPDQDENITNGVNKNRILNLKVKNGIVLRCPKCQAEIRINKITTRLDFIRETKCTNQKCKYLFVEKDFDTVANVIKNTVKTLIFYYYRKKSTCSNCRESNNTLFCRTKCSDQTCNGYMLTDYDEMSIYQELKFLYELVDIDETKKEKQTIEANFDKSVGKLQKYFEKLKSKIDFINVNVSNMFTFLNK